MKKVYLFCIIIILLGIGANVYLYMNSISANNVKINDNKEQNEIADIDNKDKLKRPIAYMINNIPEALPQSGINGADYVYEMLVEGGYTRLMAVFTKKSENIIGPIRSARHNFLDLSMEYDAIYAHFGGSPRSFEDIDLLKIPNLNGIALDGKMYWRDNTRKAPHNAYTSIEKTIEYSKTYGYDKYVPINHFKFNDEDKDLNGKKAGSVYLPYSVSQNTSYEYDEKLKLYKRYMRKKPHIDALDNSQVMVKNIIVQFAKNTTMDDENRQDIYLVGSGNGYYITNGDYIDITWSKQNRSEKTIFKNRDGKEITLNVGQTYIQIVPIDSNVIIK